MVMYSLDWPYVYDVPKSCARFKLLPEDFHVDELINGDFSGQGEHILLKIEKRGLTTEDVVKSLARQINKPARLISYAGLKDRQALSTQWLSIHAPGEEIDWIGSLEAPGWRVLEHTRHHKKLRPSFLAGNQFIVRLREVSKPDELFRRIEQVKVSGLPNYFGEQRFGQQAGNLLKAEELLVQDRKVKSQFLKGMYFSAARSWIFNLILAKRVKEHCWNTPLRGDVMQLQGSHSIFTINEIQDEIVQRIHDKDISPASPLPGKSKNLVKGTAQHIIHEIYEAWMPWILGLERQGLEEAWRANILHTKQLTYSLEDQTVKLSFMLPPGTYATVVLRELVCYS